MLKNENIICISSIDWDFLWQGHQEIMSTFAKEGNRVLFIENTGVRAPTFQDLPRLKKRIRNWFQSVKGIRKVNENLYLFSPVILPFPYSKIARWINRKLMVSAIERWMESMGSRQPVVWTFLPTGIALDIIKSVDPKAVIYYCIDNFSASSHAARRIRKSEEELLGKADIVFVTAKNLYDSCSRYNKNVHIFPFGVNLDVYKKSKSGQETTPKDLETIKHPIVGYVGGVHKWIDSELVGFLASTHKDKSFVFVGPLQTEQENLKGYPNIYFLGQKSYNELPSYVSNFDTCIIPYRITDYTRNVYPTKLNEYLTLGKPVVSTAIPEIEAFNSRNGDIVSVGSTREEFSNLLNSAVSTKATEETLRRRQEVAESEGSWQVKIEKMSNIVEEHISYKTRERSIHWKDNILELYKKSKNKLVTVFAGLAVIYFILFYTPFMWYVAEPLKIINTPRKADVILVFAAGVGESGKAGQGYGERVAHAVNLYKEGYADHLIFSSGFTYYFNEPMVMKTLAVSLGVPEKAIMLETNAKNTEEMVRFSDSILKKHRWHKVLLVTSPYHTRRAYSVFKKVDNNVEVISSPIKESIFYSRKTGKEGSLIWKRIYLKQIKGILHEYMALAHYWFKGYI